MNKAIQNAPLRKLSAAVCQLAVLAIPLLAVWFFITARAGSVGELGFAPFVIIMGMLACRLICPFLASLSKRAKRAENPYTLEKSQAKNKTSCCG